jgi:hypothetical protein
MPDQVEPGKSGMTSSYAPQQRACPNFTGFSGSWVTANAYARRLLAYLMEEFLSGRDRSLALVDRIEGIIIEDFRTCDLFEDLLTAVASYEPFGGEHYYDEEALATEFRYALRQLAQDGELGSQ